MTAWVPPSIHVPTFGPASCTECLAHVPVDLPEPRPAVHPHIAWHVQIHDRMHELEELVAALVTLVAELSNHRVPAGGELNLPDARQRIRAADLVRANAERENARDAYDRLKRAGAS